MRHVYIDPSAWVKRYYNETGTTVTNYLFDRLIGSRPSRLICSRIGLTEVISVLNRHRNADRITQSVFNMAYAYFEADSRLVRLVSVRNYQLNSSVRLLLTHNLNATDALHLQVALEVQGQLHRQNNTLLFFSADQRLLRAARQEGLVVFNPETAAETELEESLSLS